MTRYVISPAAQTDLRDASRHGDETFGVAQTDRYFADLDRAMETIAQFPLIARERTEFAPPVRIHRHGRHYIIYLALPEYVVILRVISDRVDLSEHLKLIS